MSNRWSCFVEERLGIMSWNTPSFISVYGKCALMPCLLLVLATPNLPPEYVRCTINYQVVGKDYTLLELDVSGNISRYSFEKDFWPRYEYKTRRNGILTKAMLFCKPFAVTQNGFCLTKQSFPNNCSCEQIGKDTFRLKANVLLTSQEMSHGQVSLIWPGKHGPVRFDYDLHEVKNKPCQVNYMNESHVLLTPPYNYLHRAPCHTPD
ncbi:hypothetical protein PoB_003833600 [Plakobranchus ocellatus]|uniref:Uncharacterized protein n=1 Tax=Plakobranchus ocellatus TaxID=259542 RepID=A0AAV4AKY4_9GAST|nr:hypothetical protein PoB_003833600 [Plakobranchus ocellatus]